jgi:hypothetical protein
MRGLIEIKLSERMGSRKCLRLVISQGQASLRRIGACDWPRPQQATSTQLSGSAGARAWLRGLHYIPKVVHVNTRKVSMQAFLSIVDLDSSTLSSCTGQRMWHVGHTVEAPPSPPALLHHSTSVAKYSTSQGTQHMPPRALLCCTHERRQVRLQV